MLPTCLRHQPRSWVLVYPASHCPCRYLASRGRESETVRQRHSRRLATPSCQSDLWQHQRLRGYLQMRRHRDAASRQMCVSSLVIIAILLIHIGRAVLSRGTVQGRYERRLAGTDCAAISHADALSCISDECAAQSYLARWPFDADAMGCVEEQVLDTPSSAGQASRMTCLHEARRGLEYEFQRNVLLSADPVAADTVTCSQPWGNAIPPLRTHNTT